MNPVVQIHEASAEYRARLLPVVDQGFAGIYRWHARRTLGSVSRVRAALRDGTPVGLSMSSMLEPGCGYVYYVAVARAHRESGIGAVLLDDALELLEEAGAREVFACIRPGNIPSVRLFESRRFARTSLRETARRKGLRRAVRLWLRMAAAPGERVFRRPRFADAGPPA